MRSIVAAALAAMMPLSGQAECLPPYTTITLAAMYPAVSADAWMLVETAPGCAWWGGTQPITPPPTPAEITAAAPPILRAACVQKLADARRAALDARRGETWPGMSAGEVSEAIAAGEPTPAVVADYLSDRSAVLADYQGQAATAATLSADDAWACAQTGDLP